MTLEKAIELLEYPIFKWSLEWDGRDDGLSYCDAIQMAISALRAQQEAEKNGSYIFTIRLCDNEVDRDFERFSTETLGRLAELYVGKPGLFQLETSSGQRALTITRTEVVHEPSKVTRAGDEYCWVKAVVEIPCTPENLDLIQAIQPMKEKNVSIGCSVAKSVCSICGTESGSCRHIKGQVYDGELCFMELRDPIDAYEWAFVEEPERVCGRSQDEPLTLEELREMDSPVWCLCKPIEGGNGYWCLCKNGIITTPAGSYYSATEIPHWVFLRHKPKEKTT